MSAVLEQKQDQQIAVYDEFRSQLAQLKDMNDRAVFDYEDPKGNKEARSHVYKLRQTRAAVEKARKEEKAASLEYGRRVDSEAKEIAAEIDSMIEVHAKPLEEIERRERDRVERHEANLSEIVEAGEQTKAGWIEIPLQAMKDRMAEIEAQPITKDVWEEFAVRAAEAKDAALSAMRAAIAQREEHDAKEAELERLRKEAEERAQKDRDEQIRREAAERAQREAEDRAQREREQAEAKAKAEREAGERRELELRLAAERAEREKMEAEQRAERAAEEAERKAKEAKRLEAEEAAKREADKKHRGAVNRAAAEALVAGGMSEDAAKLAVTLIAKKSVPRVTIAY